MNKTTINEMRDKILDGRYKIEENIGTGGMAEVYKGIDLLLERPVAIKILNESFSKDNAFVSRFKGEAQAAGKLNHSHIVNMYDVGCDEGYHYIIMEYVEGEILKEYIQENGKLSVEESVKIAIAIAEGLEQAHSMGIVHCDIKPHNIMITPNGNIKVTDFGIARAINSSQTLMYTTSVMGSAHYLSPEQASGKSINGTSDIYSLGVVLYEMLTGKVPYEGESPISVALKHVNEQAIPPSRYNPGIPPLLEAAVMKALAKNPGRRFTSITEMISDLRMSFGFTGRKSVRLKPTSDFATKVMPAIKDQNINPVVQSEKEKEENVLDVVTRVPQKVIFGVAIILFLIAFGWAYFAFGNFWSNASVYVPNVIGKQESIATEILLKRHLKVTVNEVSNSDIPIGEVISMMPEAGSEVKEQRTIHIVVSKGAGEVNMPDVAGMKIEDAKNTLSALGININKIETKADYSMQDGIVLEQLPKSNSKVNRKVLVTLVVNKPILKSVEMPNIEGMTIDEAKAELAKSHLQLQVNGDNTGDAVITNQKPTAGATITEGSSITVTSSIYSTKKNLKVQKGSVDITVPKGPSKQSVKIVVVDEDGKRVIYDGRHKPGDRIKRTIQGVGTVHVQVYINKHLVQDQIL